MTLGDMIKEYLKDNTMTDFAKESGLSRAYAYLLIKNKNNSGGEIILFPASTPYRSQRYRVMSQT